MAAKLTVNGVEPKSTPLEGGGKNYIIYAGDDAVLTFTATDDSGKLKEMKIVARANLDDNALNGNFLGGTQYARTSCRSYARCCANDDHSGDKPDCSDRGR